MGQIFGTADSDNALSVPVPPFVVYIARVTAVGTDPDFPAEWGNWQAASNLKALSIYKGSSVAGRSYARLQAVPGAPATSDTLLTENATPLNQGDRVAIGINDGGETPRWLFGGYMVEGQISVTPNGESEVFRVAGPEWIWGDAAGTGSVKPIVGQLRRLASADDAYCANPAGTTTAEADLIEATDLSAVFNPDGRKNMSLHDATLTPAGAPVAIAGRPWEEPERKSGAAALSDHWTRGQAVKTLCAWNNDPADTGIANPAFTSMPTNDKPLRHVNVDCHGLWHALRLVCGDEWGFYVDPAPTGITLGGDGNSWSGFQLVFFDRTSGGDANLYLNPMGTPATAATFSVARLNAVKDADKIANYVRVGSKHCRHVRMLYRGQQTGNASSDDDGRTAPPTDLQHGWAKGEGDLTTYEATDALGKKVVDSVSVGLTAGKLEDWQTRYATTGAQFAANAHVFRFFTWNEAFELSNASDAADSAKPFYGPTGSQRWYGPDLTGLADDDDNPGKYARRRRRFLDTAFYDKVNDEWQRQSPTLYLAAAKEDDADQHGPWTRVPTSHYRLDPHRGAIWIVAHDLAEWQPFLDAERNDPSSDPEYIDDRTFATLLHTGKLRMLLECTVETDFMLESTSEPTTSSGSPLVRQSVLRGSRDYVKSEEFADGLTSPSGQAANLVDTSDLAQTYADNARDAGERQRTHARVIVEADWPTQAIGLMIRQTSGRVVNLSPGADASGSQIVAEVLHCDDGLARELLTETPALKLREVDRPEVSHYRLPTRDLSSEAGGGVPASMRTIGVGPGQYVAAPRA